MTATLTWAGAVAGVLLAFALARHALRDRGIADALALTVLPMALVLAASGLRPVAFAGRTEMAFLPVWLWAVARGAALSRAVRWLAVAAAAVGIASSLTLLSPRVGEAAALRTTREVLQSAGQGDAVVAAAAFYLPARLAKDRGQLAATLTALPAELALHPGWIPARLPRPGVEGSFFFARGPCRRFFSFSSPFSCCRRYSSSF